MNKEFKVLLNPITDFFVGSGEKLFPFDYVQYENKIEVYDFLESLNTTKLDLEMAAVDEIIEIARDIQPELATLVFFSDFFWYYDSSFRVHFQ